jgi:hypothetical protein
MQAKSRLRGSINGREARLPRTACHLTAIGTAILLGMSLAPGWSVAQTPAAPKAGETAKASPPADGLKPVPVKVVIGRSKVLKPFDSVQKPVVSNSTICNASTIGEGSIVINGLVLGTAQVSVASDGQTKDVATYVIHVVRDEEYFAGLAKFINDHVPNCQITLTLSPDTRKLIVGGYVWSQDAIRQIYELLLSPELAQSDIINQMCWAYPPATVVPY